MKKTAIALLLGLGLAASLTACGGGETSAPSSPAASPEAPAASPASPAASPSASPSP
jgi:hypothetical protein